MGFLAKELALFADSQRRVSLRLALDGLTDVDTALETIDARGLYPWPVGDPAAPRWWCATCCCEPKDTACPMCEDFGGTTAPASMEALSAVAARDAAMLRKGVALVAELHRLDAAVGARVAWRVMSDDAVREHIFQKMVKSAASGSRDVASLFAREMRSHQPWDPAMMRWSGYPEPIMQTLHMLIQDCDLYLLDTCERLTVLGVTP